LVHDSEDDEEVELDAGSEEEVASCEEAEEVASCEEAEDECDEHVAKKQKLDISASKVGCD